MFFTLILYDKQNNSVLDNSLLRYTPYKRDRFISLLSHILLLEPHTAL